MTGDLSCFLAPSARRPSDIQSLVVGVSLAAERALNMWPEGGMAFHLSVELGMGFGPAANKGEWRSNLVGADHVSGRVSGEGARRRSIAQLIVAVDILPSRVGCKNRSKAVRMRNNGSGLLTLIMGRSICGLRPGDFVPLRAANQMARFAATSDRSHCFTSLRSRGVRDCADGGPSALLSSPCSVGSLAAGSLQ